MARRIKTPTFTSDIHERHYGIRNSSHKILILRFNSASEVKRSDYCKYPMERHPVSNRVFGQDRRLDSPDLTADN